MVRPASALGDVDSFSALGCCIFPPGVVSPVVGNVFINGRPAAKFGDVLSPKFGSWVCTGGGPCVLPRTVTSTSKVFINGRPSAHIGDTTNIPSGRRIVSGSPNVLLA